jgi:hypothetical protein
MLQKREEAVTMAMALGNGVHSRQEIRFPLRKIDKEEDVGGRGEEGPAGTSCLKDCHPHLPRSTMAES